MFKFDRIKLIHWLNIRKITIHKFLRDSNLDRDKFQIEKDLHYFEVSLEEKDKIANYLSVNEEQLTYSKGEDGFIFQSSGRWQCLGRPFMEENHWHQAVVFIQEEE